MFNGIESMLILRRETQDSVAATLVTEKQYDQDFRQPGCVGYYKGSCSSDSFQTWRQTSPEMPVNYLKAVNFKTELPIPGKQHLSINSIPKRCYCSEPWDWHDSRFCHFEFENKTLISTLLGDAAFNQTLDSSDMLKQFNCGDIIWHTQSCGCYEDGARLWFSLLPFCRWSKQTIGHFNCFGHKNT